MARRSQHNKFQPPTEAQRIQALGEIDKSCEDIQDVLTLGIDQSFPPIPKPDKGDWLNICKEDGQTVQEFERSQKALPSSRCNIIYLQPFGDFNSPRTPSLDIICQFSRIFFPGCQTELLPSVDLNDNMRQRINTSTHQSQYLISDFTEYLKQMQQKRNNPQELFSIGVTMVDIYPNLKWNFVFGEASVADGIGLFSFARFDPLFPHPSVESFQQLCTQEERVLILRRALNTYIPEVMHLFGLKHCIYYLCLMNGTNGEIEMDNKLLYLCPICLRKMSIVFKNQNYDIIHMYKNLSELSKTLGFQQEIAWYTNRLQILNKDS
ncbi:hypothetical protein I4U23_012635 [Adineta vaga]|nr:hypothetical protein I4U23_012635 [Adineta vaga]